MYDHKSTTFFISEHDTFILFHDHLYRGPWREVLFADIDCSVKDHLLGRVVILPTVASTLLACHTALLYPASFTRPSVIPPMSSRYNVIIPFTCV